MSELAHPFQGLVDGRLRTYFDEAYDFVGRGQIRGAYDYAMLAFNSTLFEIRPGSDSLFTKLESLVADGKLGKEVLEQARGSSFLGRHERGITDMDLTYMAVEDLDDLLAFLERFYASLGEHGVQLANDPRGQ